MVLAAGSTCISHISSRVASLQWRTELPDDDDDDDAEAE